MPSNPNVVGSGTALVMAGLEIKSAEPAITASDASALAITASPASLVAGAAVSAVPEPTTLGLLGIGAAGLLGRRRRRNV